MDRECLDKEKNLIIYPDTLRPLLFEFILNVLFD